MRRRCGFLWKRILPYQPLYRGNSELGEEIFTLVYYTRNVCFIHENVTSDTSRNVRCSIFDSNDITLKKLSLLGATEKLENTSDSIAFTWAEAAVKVAIQASWQVSFHGTGNIRLSRLRLPEMSVTWHLLKYMTNCNAVNRMLGKNEGIPLNE